MGKNPADQFYWADWLEDVELQMASASSRGIWMNALCRMWASRTRGQIQGTREIFCGIPNCKPEEFEVFVSEIQTLNFGEYNAGSNGILTITNRRMFRKGISQEQNRLRQKKFYDKNLPNATPNAHPNGNLTPLSSSSSSIPPIVPQSPNAKNHLENGKVPYSEIRALWIEILCPPLSIPREQNDTWHKDCRARWLTYDKARERGLEWCRDFFEKIKTLPFYMGNNDRGWTPTISWVWQKRNFFKLLEQKVKQ